MRGAIFATGPCYICGEIFCFHPERVPSIGGNPICEDCMKIVNEIRASDGLPEVVIYPDSYGADHG